MSWRLTLIFTGVILSVLLCLSYVFMWWALADRCPEFVARKSPFIGPAMDAYLEIVSADGYTNYDADHFNRFNDNDFIEEISARIIYDKLDTGMSLWLLYIGNSKVNDVNRDSYVKAIGHVLAENTDRIGSARLGMCLIVLLSKGAPNNPETIRVIRATYKVDAKEAVAIINEICKTKLSEEEFSNASGSNAGYSF